MIRNAMVFQLLQKGTVINYVDELPSFYASSDTNWTTKCTVLTGIKFLHWLAFGHFDATLCLETVRSRY